MRSAAYHIIERFIDHLDGSRFMEMDQIIYILNLLKDSLGKSRSKLASIVTIFLARAVKVMLKPGITVMTIYTLKIWVVGQVNQSEHCRPRSDCS